MKYSCITRSKNTVLVFMESRTKERTNRYSILCLKTLVLMRGVIASMVVEMSVTNCWVFCRWASLQYCANQWE